MNVCKCVTYSGTVQGVGFRYTARELAQYHSARGFVRNLPNGTVELVAEGPAETVTAFLQAVADRMGDYIAHQDVRDEELHGYNDFAIRH
jgi:acylphosphatase